MDIRRRISTDGYPPVDIHRLISTGGYPPVDICKCLDFWRTLVDNGWSLPVKFHMPGNLISHTRQNAQFSDNIRKCPAEKFQVFYLGRLWRATESCRKLQRTADMEISTETWWKMADKCGKLRKKSCMTQSTSGADIIGQKSVHSGQWRTMAENGGRGKRWNLPDLIFSPLNHC